MPTRASWSAHEAGPPARRPRRARALAALAAFAALAALAALAPTLGESRSPPVRSGLHGVVERGPVTPVCTVGVPCDEPAAHATVLFSRNGTTVRTRTDAHGRYRVRLRPGRWAVRKPDWGPGGIEPAIVRVPAGRFRPIDLRIDTGIR
ncbi:MAG: hypothetical protein ABR583_12170 [Gaiellaceae bacterium]